jgi:glutathione synthase/RimK-type ligase-like ATP-grasp enzyme
MKKVLILFGKGRKQNSKPFINEKLQYSYEYFYSLCRRSGIQLYRASYEWYDNTTHSFSCAWAFEDDGCGWKKVDSIRPDLIYDKTKPSVESYSAKLRIGERYPFLNDLNFTKIMDDKFVTSLIFPKWSKKNWFIKSEAELALILPELKSEKIVVKPVSESGGKGVCILDKSEISSLDFSSEKIVQEFIDSSLGIPGICDSTHDLRLVFVDDKLIYAYTREPMDGCLLANLSQGGSLVIIPIQKLPRSLDPLLEYIHTTLNSFTDRVFAVDFMFDEHGQPWIVEFNSMPGLYFTEEEKPYMMEMYEALIAVFSQQIDLIQKNVIE